MLPAGLLAVLELDDSVEDGDGDHDAHGAQPDGLDDAVRVGQGLPPPRLERLADGVEPLQGDGHKSAAAHAHRHRCRSK